MNRQYDAIIIGGGVSGVSLYYQLSNFTNIKSVCLIEKHPHVAPLNSSSWANSQTLHIGDIESNYTLDKAAQVKQQAYMVRNYALKQPNAAEIIFKCSKMLLAVGDQEVAELRSRYTAFKETFPYIEWWDKEQIAEVEPNVVLTNSKQSRSDTIAAMGCKEDWCAVNYAKLTESLLDSAEHGKAQTETRLSTKVVAIKQDTDGFDITVDKAGQSELLRCRFLVVSAGAHSLLFAHRLGYGKHLSTLSVGGSFYYSDIGLNGKVYTMQNPHLPFAAVHGDFDIVEKKTRFGPTALFLMKLERYQSGTIGEFFELIKLDKGFLRAIWNMIRVPDIRNYVFKNFLFEVPFLREYLFAKDINKIIPSIKAQQLQFAKHVGGNRPQVIDRNKGQMIMGEAALQGDNCIFNITPSPGASTCLANARNNLVEVAQVLKLTINEEELSKVLDYEHE